MSLEATYWSVLIVGILIIIGCSVGVVWMIRGDILYYKGGVIIAIMIALGFWSGYILIAPNISSVVDVAKQEYVETDAMVVECVFRNPGKYQDRYKKLVIYIPEIDEYYEITIVGSNKTSVGIEVGKTFRVKYYPLLLERPNPNERLVEFLYCIDDINE